MLAGLIKCPDAIEYRLSVSGASDGTFGGWNGRLTTFFLDNPITLNTGIDLFVESSLTARSYELNIGDLGISETRTVGSSGSLHSSVLFEGLELYCTLGGLWTLKIATIKWYIGGSLDTTFGPFDFDGSYPCCPSSVPIIGIPPLIQGGAGFSPEFSDGCTGGVSIPYQSNTATAEILGGWRLKYGSDWFNAPIDLPSTDWISATDCYNITLNTEEFQSQDGFTTEKRSDGAYAYAWPNMEKSLARLNSDYEGLVLRTHLPGWAVRTTAISGTYNCAGDGTPSTTITDSYVYPETTPLLAGVTSTPHVIEAEITRDTPAPYGESHVETIYTTSGWTQTNNASILGPVHTSFVSVPDLLNHPEWIGVFWNTWFSPHWSYVLWFPPDSASSSFRWNLLGADVAIDYWIQLFQQHMTNPSLPSGEDTKRRVNVDLEPVAQNGNFGLASSFADTPCWWGATHFSVEEETFPTEFTTDISSLPRFTFKNGAGVGIGSVGSSITLTSGDAIEFDMASFDDFPYMATTLADRLKVTWSDANIGAVKLFAIGVDGTSKQIGPTAGITSAEIYRIVFGGSGKWATSAGASFDAGYLTDDYTPDAGVSADDITAATLADAERISSFGLLPGFSPVKIRIEITRAGSYTGAVTIAHPTFYMAPWSDAKAFHESGLVSTILFKNGPMVRYGALSFYDWILDAPLTVPNPVSEISNKTTIGDLWAWENVFLRGESALTGLLTRMELEFVEDEEFPAGVTKHLWRYSDGESIFIDSLSGVFNSAIGPRLWYLSSRRCLPPLAMFPEKARSTGTGWVTDGDPEQQSCSEISNKQPHIVPGNVQPQLIHSSTNHLAFETAPTGWSVGVFSGAVTNNESQDWVLKWNETEWFEMRPWRGQVGMFGIAGVEESVMSFDVDHNSHLHILATVTDAGKVKIGIAGNPLAWDYITTTIDASWVCCRIDRDSTDQAILLLVEDAGSVKLYKSVDRAESFTLARTVTSSGTPTKPAILVGRNGVRQMYWIDGTDVKGQIADRADNIIESTFTAVTGVEDRGVAVDEDVTETGKKRTVLYVVQGGALTELKSDDGKTFV
jgi:hypothetical protein